MENNLVKNNSDGYGYKYAALSDIAKQGYEIPKMTTKIVEGNEYVFYFDKEIKEWLQGAKVVIPESPKNKDGKDKMNIAQLYGSALTYARRYTTLMALQLACEDDKELETKGPELASEGQINYIKSLFDVVKIAEMLKHYQVESLEQMPKDVATNVISKAKEEIEKRKAKQKEERWEGV